MTNTTNNIISTIGYITWITAIIISTTTIIINIISIINYIK